MVETRPTYFFKYVTAQVAHLVLQNRTLRWSTPGLLNDPFDIQFDLHLEVDRDKLRSLAKEKRLAAVFGPSYTPHPANKAGAAIVMFRQHPKKPSREEFERKMDSSPDQSLENVIAHLPEEQRKTREILAKTKILCLSAIGDSLPMWSYYAENHQGAVLRFKSVGMDSIYSMAKPIIYTEQMPRLFDEEELSNIMTGTAITDYEKMLAQLVYTKAKGWEHEQEWRLHLGPGPAPDDPFTYLRFDALELDAVILGCTMTSDCRMSLRDLASRLYPQTKVLQAAKATHEFKLAIPEV